MVKPKINHFAKLDLSGQVSHDRSRNSEQSQVVQQIFDLIEQHCIAEESAPVGLFEVQR
ncbi:hypothetical protein D3C77_462230 [compost metagenome]